LGIGFVAYAPLGRGLLTGKIRSLDTLEENDRRRDMPRFQGENLGHNLELLGAADAVAARCGLSTAAVALAWVLSRGRDIVAIPGCKRRDTLTDSLTALEAGLSREDLKEIDAAFDAAAVRGTRYPEKQMARLGL
ncbi:MAG: aldo/keto reductase, partial [Limibacillus sp.]